MTQHFIRRCPVCKQTSQCRCPARDKIVINEVCPGCRATEEKTMIPTPLNGNVILEVANAPKKSEGGILIPDSVREPMFRGTVRSTFKGCTEVKKGDKVLFARYVGTSIKVGGKEYLVMAVKDILAVVEE